MQPDDFFHTLKRIVEILEQLTIPYHITGGLAVTVYGEPRSTQDIDIVVGPAELSTNLVEFLRRCGESFQAEPAEVSSAIQRGGTFQLLDKQTCFKIDLYPREAIAGELSRSSHVQIAPDCSVRIVGPVDAVLAKLLWIKKGSHRSRRDVQSMMQALSPDYRSEVETRARELELLGLLNEVLADREPTE